MGILRDSQVLAEAPHASAHGVVKLPTSGSIALLNGIIANATYNVTWSIIQRRLWHWSGSRSWPGQ